MLQTVSPEGQVNSDRNTPNRKRRLLAKDDSLSKSIRDTIISKHAAECFRPGDELLSGYYSAKHQYIDVKGQVAFRIIVQYTK